MLLIISLYQFQDSDLDKGIIFSSVGFLAIALLLFFWLFYKRARRIRQTRLSDHYQAKVDYMLFQYLFTSSNHEALFNSSDFVLYQKHSLFQRIAVQAIVSLRYSYTGEYRTKLNQLYIESGLVEYSIKKLNSKKWPDNVEGIRDLSSMNVQIAYPKIEQFLNHKHSLVRTEAILGMIKLKGIGELYKITNSDIYLDDWTQSNILFVLQEYRIEPPSNLIDLLYSKNLSIVLLIVRLIKYYNSTEHAESLTEYLKHTMDLKLTNEIVQTLEKLNNSKNPAQ